MSTLSNGVSSVLLPIGGNSAALGAAAGTMAELAVAGCIGIGCVHQEFLTPPMVKALSRTTFSILLPSFLSTSIIKTVTKYGLNGSSLAVPFLAIIQSLGLYTLTTRVSLPLLGIDRDSDDGRGATVCCSFGNSGVVPLIFCESLFRSSTDNISKSIAFVSLFLIGWSPFFWGFGRSVLLGKNANKTEADGKAKTLAFVKSALPPPIVGVFVGLLSGLTPVRKLFLSSEERKAPMSVVFNTVQNFGRAASPLSLLVLVSSLAIGAGVGGHITQGANSVPVRTATDDETVGFLTKWSLVSISRFLLSPVLMFGLLKTAAWIGIIGCPDDNPMLWFVCILQSSMPPAQNSVLMLQVADKSKKAGEMAKFLFSVYATSMLPVVLILSLSLEKLGLA